jgi:hypothetical protein
MKIIIASLIDASRTDISHISVLLDDKVGEIFPVQHLLAEAWITSLAPFSRISSACTYHGWDEGRHHYDEFEINIKNL